MQKSTGERFQAFRVSYLTKSPNADFKQISAAWRAHERGEEVPVTLVERRRSPSSPKNKCGEPHIQDRELEATVEQQINELLAKERSVLAFGLAAKTLESALVVVAEPLHRNTTDYRLESYNIRIVKTEESIGALVGGKYHLISASEIRQPTPEDLREVLLTHINPLLRSPNRYLNQALSTAVITNRPACINNLPDRSALLREMLVRDLNIILAGQADAHKWLGNEASIRLTADVEARLMLYLWVRLAHEPRTKVYQESYVDVSSTRADFKRIYNTL